MTFDPETMTGWDSDFASHDDTPQQQAGAVERLLLALHRNLKPSDKEQYIAIVSAMSKIDWHAMNFAQNALDSGEELYSCFSTNDILIKYTPPPKVNPDQAELAF